MSAADPKPSLLNCRQLLRNIENEAEQASSNLNGKTGAAAIGFLVENADSSESVKKASDADLSDLLLAKPKAKGEAPVNDERVTSAEQSVVPFGSGVYGASTIAGAATALTDLLSQFASGFSHPLKATFLQQLQSIKTSYKSKEDEAGGLFMMLRETMQQFSKEHQHDSDYEGLQAMHALDTILDRCKTTLNAYDLKFTTHKEFLEFAITFLTIVKDHKTKRDAIVSDVFRNYSNVTFKETLLRFWFDEKANKFDCIQGTKRKSEVMYDGSSSSDSEDESSDSEDESSDSD